MTKKFFTAVYLAVLVATVFTGCDTADTADIDNTDGDGGGGNNENVLTIKNHSSYTITTVQWKDDYENTFQSNIVNSISSGEEVKLTHFTSRRGYLYFSVKGGSVALRTTSFIYFDTEFAILDTTSVENDRGHRGSLSDFAKDIPPPINTKLTIKNESAYEVIGVRWNNTPFAGASNSIFPGTSITKDVKAGSGYIRLRPRTNPYNLRTNVLLVIAEGETKEVIIFDNTPVRKDIDNTVVTLASVASVKFTAEIGDVGLGGGIIFFAAGGEFKEVSDELGVYNWYDANTAAKAHRGGGFDDWELPTSGDLTLMYDNLHKKGLGGFSTVRYWGQKRYVNSAYYLNFSDGKVDNSDLSSLYRTRAVRSFSTN